MSKFYSNSSLFLFRNRTLFYNVLGTIFDKILPILISLLLSSYMSAETFGSWAIYYQFLLFVNAMLVSPLLGFFNRKFYQSSSAQRIIFYNHPILITLLILSQIIFYIFFSSRFDLFFLEFFALIGFIFYNYYAQYLRLKSQDLKYTKLSILRFFIFLSIVAIFYYFYSTITYLALIVSFCLSHFLLLIQLFKILYKGKVNHIADTKEFLSLSFYGFFSSSVNGIDKFLILAVGNSTAFIGVYSYFLAIASSPTVLIESIKKVITPLQFKEYSNYKVLSKGTLKKIYFFLMFFFLVQIILPQLLLATLKELNLINDSFKNIINDYLIILIFSIGLFVFSIYHFINPKLIFYKKSKYMLIALLIATFIYIIFIVIYPKVNDLLFYSILKAVMLSLSTIVTYYFFKKNKHDFN